MQLTTVKSPWFFVIVSGEVKIMIKMVALDLDGTLLTSDKQISPRNEQALKALHQQGVKIVLCTGRPINAIWKYIEQLGLTNDDDYTITFNGALVIQNTEKTVLSQKGISKQKLQLLHDFAQTNGLPLDILDFEDVYPITDLKRSVYQQMLNAKIDFVPTDFDQLDADDYSKAVMATEPAILNDAFDRVTDEMFETYHIVRSQPKILEFLDHDMDKAVGLEALLNHFGWTFENLMVFGDAENDLGMLKSAQVGVVMENGKDEIKRQGTDVTGTNDADGVAEFVEKYADFA